MLPNIAYSELNRLESNDSTSLHEATLSGHKEIVWLLLHERGCQRHQRNNHGLTAYEVAKTDEMRQLFHRPSNINRFCDNLDQDMQLTFEIISLTTNDKASQSHDAKDDADENDEIMPGGFVQGLQTKEEIQRALAFAAHCRACLQSKGMIYISCFIGKYIYNNHHDHNKHVKQKEFYNSFIDKTFRITELQNIIDTEVLFTHPEYEKCNELLSIYSNSGKCESLLQLYTLETPFYKKLREKQVLPLFSCIALNLPYLKRRYFRGESYRGVTMTNDDLRSYRWALKNNDRLIQIKTFASTSTDREIAESFAQSLETSSIENKISVLMTFRFPQVCDTAINLGKIPKYDLPCLSEYEDESEILILPLTFFRVKNIEINNLSNGRQLLYIIRLENVLFEKASVLHTLPAYMKLCIKHEYKKQKEKHHI
ncbi:unnamed protein product [Didymodactylos carnosus]|nr:unnamed protein product [Didymodactylos carnosus]CAF4224737.1 unnamed protein product [Didymodactylos carnosus]